LLFSIRILSNVSIDILLSEFVGITLYLKRSILIIFFLFLILRSRMNQSQRVMWFIICFVFKQFLFYDIFVYLLFVFCFYTIHLSITVLFVLAFINMDYVLLVNNFAYTVLPTCWRFCFFAKGDLLTDGKIFKSFSF